VFAPLTIRPALACLLACALLAAATATAIAEPTDQERYLASYGPAPALDSGTAAAEAQEDYYQSYGPPEPLNVSDGIPWLAIVLPAGVIALAAVVVVGTTRLRRRNRAARPRARVAV
jgi:hypothetical protein